MISGKQEFGSKYIYSDRRCDTEQAKRQSVSQTIFPIWTALDGIPKSQRLVPPVSVKEVHVRF